jgi:hypothetical protein
MVSTTELMAAGTPSLVARMLGSDPPTSFTGAGTTQATATKLTADYAILATVPLNSGFRLQSEAAGSGVQILINSGVNVATIYPEVGEKINNQATNAGVQLAPGKAALLWSTTGQWAFIASA